MYSRDPLSAMHVWNNTDGCIFSEEGNARGLVGGIYDGRSGYQDHQSGCFKDFYGMEAFRILYCFCNAFFMYLRFDRELFLKSVSSRRAQGIVGNQG